jgi:signal transduction histidine kinase
VSPRPNPEAALVRRVRLRLLAWSGGTTLAVLLLLGTVIYLAVANSLARAGTEQLRSRATFVTEGLRLPFPIPQPGVAGAAEGPVTTITGGGGAGVGPGGFVAFDASQPGLVVDGTTSGTVAFIVGPTDRTIPDMTQINQLYGTALPDEAGITAVRAEKVTPGTEVVSTAEVAGTPIRILTTSVERPDGVFAVQVVGDRADEVRTLTVLLTVLVAGGLLVLIASLGVGWVYADRALVPIRDALRRQREFAADASHELRTPLAIIRGSVEELRREPDRNAAAGSAALDDIDDEVVRLGALVDDLLLLARTDSGTLDLVLAPTDLGEIALDASTGLATIAAEREVRVEVDAEPLPLTADADRLRQLVRILGDNAVRHAPSGSTVGIAVHPRDSGQAGLVVEDRGPGFREADLPHIFERFWRAPDAPAGGTGLGLTIAAWIVERHKGTIAAGNRPGGGARIEVRLPIR